MNKHQISFVSKPPSCFSSVVAPKKKGKKIKNKKV
jgi:hypothetical protein